MRNRIFTSLIILVGLFTTYAWPQSIKPTLISQNVSLASGNSTITYVKLLNTHSRTYEDSDSNFRFTANESDKGVFWRIQCIGVKMEDPFGKIILKNEKGEVFKPMINVITTSERSKGYDESGTVIYDGPSTTFFLLGPDDSKTVQIMFGDASVKLKVIK